MPQKPYASEHEKWKAHDNCCVWSMQFYTVPRTWKSWTKILKKQEKLYSNGRNMYSVYCIRKWNILMHGRIQPILHRFQALSQAHKCHYKCIHGKVDGKHHRSESVTKRMKLKTIILLSFHKRKNEKNANW